MERRSWLVDASIYIFRAWFSIPDRWHTDAGMPLNAVYGYAGFLVDLLSRVQHGDAVAAAFDESLGSCFRNEVYPDYKSSRALPDEALAFQLQACRELTECAGIACFASERYEADDFLATLARLSAEQSTPFSVVTRDKDLGQLLLHEGALWWDFAADQQLGAADFFERFGVRPCQFADYLALVGDTVDDIPGVPGVGPKTAAALLAEFGSVEAIAARFEAVADLPVRGAKKLAERLPAHWEQVRVSHQLATLEDRVPGVDALPEYTLLREHVAAVCEYLDALGLAGPMQRRWQQLPIGGLQ
ncbi:hypothetical protein BST95_11985 [Halioglobus japonicus]|uniref:Flap endonuclease n=1 Tax=Halioglobus japonicus TaxID=930805 RepID=A0AAP8MG57_9GAMM|nr:5'-3' exonuclease H3TH domain-containing protein [Halioglobus japonicus]AQA18851.1 hypothetical protein BST95_11985 [Halioglobus japonicus]PLW86887.1 flap endonuclease [Halioglobus japonicus]GHD23520.1 hypothetical protein GCM10007052_36330 [Halioglobus japonicus]